MDGLDYICVCLYEHDEDGFLGYTTRREFIFVKIRVKLSLVV